MKYVMDCLYALALLAISPIAVYRMVRHNRYRKGWPNRLGRLTRKHPQKKCVWLHAVSVGEVNAARTIIDRLRTRDDIELVITTTTDTGFARATSLFAPDLSVFFFPFDFSRTMTRAFDNLNPALCLLIELEVWPNLVEIASARSIPVVVVNGRLSTKSFTRYSKIKRFIAPIFSKLTLVLAQTDEYAARFTRLGLPPEKVSVTGSLKYDTAQIADKVPGADQLAAQLNITGQRLWVAGATGDEEEKLLLDVFRRLTADNRYRDLRLAIIPRKPERFDDVADLIRESGLPLVRYSQIRAGAPLPPDKGPVILGDTMGDLRKFYSLATIVFVGRSLVPMGGSDMIESAALGKCTIFGPHAFNFEQSVNALLRDNGAIMVNNPDQLLDQLKNCLDNPQQTQKIAAAGQQTIKNNQGATERTLSRITALLNSPTSSR